MKIDIVLQPDPAEEAPDDPIFQTLREIGFEDQSAADGSRKLTYDGTITHSDLSYGASMVKSLLSGRR